MTLTLYHGSRGGISGAIRPDRSDGACDFGCGFYMGTDVHQIANDRMFAPVELVNLRVRCDNQRRRGAAEADRICRERRREMYAVADYDRMRRVYPGYHTVSCELAVNWLKEEPRR